MYKLLLRIFDVVQQLQPLPICNTCHQDRVEVERFWNLQRSKYVNHNDTKMIDRWNVNKLTAARTKKEVDKLRTRVVQ